MPIGCFIGIPIDQTRVALTILSFSAAFITFAIMSRFKLSTKLKVSLIYAHLITLFFPFVLLTTNVACGMTCASCYTNIYSLVAYSLPTTLVAGTLAGFVVIPSLFIFTNQKREITGGSLFNFAKKHTRKLDIAIPKMYVVNKAEPIAFSFRSFKSAIFLSVGLFDLLNKKETEAVVLHELAHIHQKSSIIKFSNQIFNTFSPLSIIARFNHDSNEEEKSADKFVVSMQKTGEHIKSAKRKLRNFNRHYST